MPKITSLQQLTIKEYLSAEKTSEQRHEYVDGYIYAKVGGTERHNQICLTIASILREHLRDKSCQVLMSDMKVQTEKAFYYSDVMVVCGESEPTALYQTRPVFIVEVLSDSTEAKDRLEKFVAYQRVTSSWKVLVMVTSYA
jgi:Uma2 family endonuclease